MQPNAHSAAAALAHHQYLKDQLRAQFPDADEEVLADTLEGISDLDQLLVALIRSADEDQILVNGIKQRIAELTERKARLEQRAEAKAEIALRTMERADLQKIEAPDFTISTRKNPPKVIITDEAMIPAVYKQAPKPPQPDKVAIAQALKLGDPVPGASLSNGGVALAIRRK